MAAQLARPQCIPHGTKTSGTLRYLDHFVVSDLDRLMTRRAVDTRVPAKRARVLVRRWLDEHGWTIVEQRDGGITYLQATSRSGRNIQVRIKARTSGTWQATVGSGQQLGGGSGVQTFWVFVDLGAAPVAFYVAPDAWVRRDIRKAHEAYLAKWGGRRAQNNDSKHHAIALPRIVEWRDRWDQLEGEA